ncbi:MAG: molecular chaperone HtpG [Acetivibrionales bacterium]|jgi:molecular chaperone HtpG|nr:molecular chaperone HtpG [Clostridiaceae bacterium]
MINEKGNISIQTENIFPIIKKWLYSEKDIFLRELVSNASDAISKLKKLSDIGEAKLPDDYKPRITVSLNKEKGTIAITDNGIGMTDEEVKKYINQIAFSGAKDFIEKYKDKTDDQQIIGHFGLGFYSAFMVSTKVRIDTLSYQEGQSAVAWESEGDTEYTMEGSDKKDFGTTITLFMADDSKEFLDSWKLREILRKYFAFLQYEIYLIDENEKKEEKQEDKKEDQKEKEEKPLNNTSPLWLKNPRECTDEEYKSFYHEVFTDFNDPLFWIHINMDYPFNMKGIIYFPKLKHEFETMEGKIKLFYNQVFVADNIKEVIPEFLMLLKGCLDCPDLPLNVSRSFLQNEGYVDRISSHITKKVADKLQLLFKKDRESYEKYWEDINPFVKYGCIREPKFFEKVKSILIYKTINDKFVTQEEYLEQNKEADKKIYYVNDEKQQAQYIRMFKDNNMDAVILNTMIDSHFISFMEAENRDVKFMRVDADIIDNMKDDESKGDENKNLQEKLEKIIKEATGKDKLKIKVEGLKSESTPAVILLSEESRRFKEMSRSFGGSINTADLFPDEETLVLNSNNTMVKRIADLYEEDNRKEDALTAACHIYDLALLNHRQLEPDAMVKFIERSNSLLMRLL